VHFPDIKKQLLAEALECLLRAARDIPGLKKKPSTSELLDWIKLLVAEDIPPEALREKDTRQAIPPLYGAMLKNEQDMHLFERLVFMSGAPVLTELFYKLRKVQIPVSLTEYLTLLARSKRAHRLASANDFYYLCAPRHW
jgi:hypothetical protein